ncbi:molybdopterin-dependent oxidoreductase [Streptomyces yaizuensis]|uniref:Molybdopterin-dependent oxidoreductase n=1 Tax=Streptomyces yaizuensis TaxID=2989713 RepID=A0ABQ5P9M4_9ACTN|nr:molybdopterin-dependent oxidoreductase [Streptomyces sp. YSPA8]GLF99200.1 molybdopterin-dependent oxidoreductase [Streptomyces sp. YSPA8]
MSEEDTDPAPRPGRIPRLLAAVAGLLSGAAALTVAHAAAVRERPTTSPVVAVGGAMIDRVPTAVKDWAIRAFGENDKAVLQLGIVAVLAVAAAVLGRAALTHRRAGAAGVLLFGAVGAWAALGRPDAAGPLDALPSLAGALAGALVLYVLTGRLAPRRAAAPGPGTAPAADSAAGATTSHTQTDARTHTQTHSGSRGRGADEPPWDRRGFVAAATAAAALSAGAGGLARTLGRARSGDAASAREAVTLPPPVSPARPVPRAARLPIPGVSPFITPVKDFYRVDTALVVPEVDATRWRLRIRGTGVTRPADLSFADLLGRGLIERDITLTCVSNEVGGPYVGNARWIGVPLAGLLAACGVRPPSRGGPADQLVARSVDGMTIGTPVEDVMDGRDALLAVGMNGEPLTFEHGFPVRMVVPGLYGYVSACKWIEELELTTFDAYDAYWVKRKWARRAPVGTQSRIDTPRPFSRPDAGPVMVAGVAWAQRRGIRRVEVSVDDGPWRDAVLAAEDSRDTWRQWSFAWRPEPGTHTLTVRATDGDGAVQPAERTRPFPDGARGRHSVVVTVV